MKGLLKKDLALLTNTAKVYLPVIAMGIFLGIIKQDMRNFVLSWSVIMLGISGVSTISYDDFDNGMPFLMTLGVSRKTYVKEKYLLCYMTALTGCLISLAVGCLIFGMKPIDAGGESLLAFLSLFFATAGIMLSFMIPIRLRFGPEQSRIVGIGLVVVIWIVVFGITRIIKFLPVSAKEILNKIGNASDGMVVLGFFLIFIVASGISYGYSAHVLEKKEF